MHQGNNGNGKIDDPRRHDSGSGHGSDHGHGDGIRGTDGSTYGVGERIRGTDGSTYGVGERIRGTDGSTYGVGERIRWTDGSTYGVGERIRGTDRPGADLNDEIAVDAADAVEAGIDGKDNDGAGHDEGGDDDIGDDETGDDDTGNRHAAGRRWIRNIIILLLVAGLIGNVMEFWSRLFNAQTLPLLFQSRELSGREEVERHKDAVVLIGTDKGKGSGFHVSDGYIVTNYHVIEGAARTAVLFPGIGASFAADVAGFDPDLDLAILRVDSEGVELPYLEIEREHGWKPGERVYVIGNPLTLTQIAVEGTIRGTMRIRGRREPVMAVDAPIHQGNSGSPVINENGRAIAVIYATSEITLEGKTEPVGLAVPLRDVKLLPRAPDQ